MYFLYFLFPKLFTFTNGDKNKVMELQNQIKYCIKLLKKCRVKYLIVTSLSSFFTISGLVFFILHLLNANPRYILMVIVMILAGMTFAFLSIKEGRKINALKGLIKQKTEEN